MNDTKVKMDLHKNDRYLLYVLFVIRMETGFHMLACCNGTLSWSKTVTVRQVTDPMSEEMLLYVPKDANWRKHHPADVEAMGCFVITPE